MKFRATGVVVGFLSLVLSMSAQTASSPASGQVPPLIQLSNIATDQGGNSLSGVVTITFSLYSSQQGGEALWTETQNNVQLDAVGHYSVELGVTKPAGVPTALFTTGEARWLGVRIAEQPGQPRVLLLSVPYALKAGDATTIGGLPPSAFVLAAPAMTSASSAPAAYAASDAALTDSIPAADVTGSGTMNFIPLWTSASNIGNSVLFQSGAGATAKIGINTGTPATTLDVKGAGTIRGQLSILGTLVLPATGAATAAAGKDSQPLTLAASAFNSSSSAAVNQTFRWQAEPAANDTSTPSGTLNLLFAEGSSTAAETGLHIGSNGQITFAAGQAFPGTGNGTITSVTAGTDLTGGGSSGAVTLNLDTTKVPQLNVVNFFDASQTVGGNITATETVTGGVINATIGYDLQGGPFISGSFQSADAFLGFAGNSTMTGQGNTASGYHALWLNTLGNNNTASGDAALSANTSGASNTADGFNALSSNNSGDWNTADGANALPQETAGDYNTGAGYSAGETTDGSNLTGSFNVAVGAQSAFGTGTLVNATVVGANATVGESNALVLGQNSAGSPGKTWVNVGIGTAVPSSILEAYATNGTGLGPTLTLTNGGIGSNVSSSLDFNTFPPAYGASYNPTARILATDDGHFSSNLVFYSNTPGFQNAGLRTNMTISSNGDVAIAGNLSKGGGSFKIDHPLAPASKYLYHSFVESPDMMNVYNGNVITNQHGLATVILPDYFEALNRDFRYQLTVIGQFAQAIVAKEVSRNRFTIKTSKPGVKVSWQVTGIRQDAYANAHRIQVEEEKPPQEQGHYLHPELFGAPPEQAVGYPAPAATYSAQSRQ